MTSAVPIRATPADWLGAARPRTLPAALAPVGVGIGVAVGVGSIVVWRAVLAVLVGLSIQIATNFANDYSDGVRGTDSERVGPTRLVASGRVAPSTMRLVAAGSFGVAACAGLVLALSTSLLVLVVGAGCILAGWFYTGGRHPYGYYGYGELFVFVFFGLVAVVGTAYVASGRVLGLSFVAGVPVGALAVALLVVNNLRDISTDAASGKRTLAVRLGATKTKMLYFAMFVLAVFGVAACAVSRPLALFGLVGLGLGIFPLRLVFGPPRPRALGAALGMTGLVELVMALGLSVGLAR